MREKGSRPRLGSTIVGVVIGVVAVGIVPVAAGIGDPVLQGRANHVDKKTALTGQAAGGPILKVVNSSPSGTGIKIDVQPGQPALVVTTKAKVKRLNADRLDGLSSADLMPGGAAPRAGTTIRGAYFVGGSAAGGELAFSQASFGYQLGSEPTPHFLVPGAAPTADCPGTYAQPEAAPGHFCVYEEFGVNVTSHQVSGRLGDGSTYSTGAGMWVSSTASGSFFSLGTWAVTAGP